MQNMQESVRLDGEPSLKKARLEVQQECVARTQQSSQQAHRERPSPVCSVVATPVGADDAPDDRDDRRQVVEAALVADKYLLLDQVEGSSLYRCLNVHTHQELVCKVSVDESALLRVNCPLGSG